MQRDMDHSGRGRKCCTAALLAFLLILAMPAESRDQDIRDIYLEASHFSYTPLDTGEDCGRLIMIIDRQISRLKSLRASLPMQDALQHHLAFDLKHAEAARAELLSLRTLIESSELRLSKEERDRAYSMESLEYAKTRKYAEETKEHALKSPAGCAAELGRCYMTIGYRAAMLEGVHALYKTLIALPEPERHVGKVPVPVYFSNPRYQAVEFGMVMMGTKPSCFSDFVMMDCTRYGRVWKLMGLELEPLQRGVLYNPGALRKIMEDDPVFYGRYGKTPREVVCATFSKMDSVGELLGYGKARNIEMTLPSIEFYGRTSRKQIMAFRIKPEDISRLVPHYCHAIKEVTGEDSDVILTYDPDKSVEKRYGIRYIIFKMERMSDTPVEYE
ncbi:MAG: hypothetical protein RDV48_24230 [Candidatus Eremiobacteraeota bacterium]|nr:hypothetical protein [Candidatus Eremiobacteraeota bacterium]